MALEPKELKDAEQVALVSLSKEIKVPGFRKGKVPASVVAKHVSPQQVAEHTLERALSKAVAEAFLEEGLQALDRPEVDVKKFVPGAELEFTATAEILPKVKLGDYKKLSAKLKETKVDKKDIDEIIERIQKGYAEKSVVDRPAKNGDEVKIDFVGKKDGVEFDGGKATDFDLGLGSGSFIEGFEEGIIGKKAGDEFSLDLKFPENYHAEELKGAPVVFDVKLKEVKEQKLPEINDELAKKAGPFESLKEMKDDIKRELTNQKERENKELLKDELVAELVEKSHVPVPEVLVEDQIKSIERDMMQNLMYRGFTLDAYLQEKGFKDKDEWIKKEVRPTAEKRVQAGLVLAELTKVEKIQATEEELLNKMNELAMQYSDKNFQKQLRTPEAQRDLANRILTDKAVELLIDYNWPKDKKSGKKDSPKADSKTDKKVAKKVDKSDK